MLTIETRLVVTPDDREAFVRTREQVYPQAREVPANVLRFIALYGEEPVGYAWSFVTEVPGIMEFGDGGVIPTYRREGVATSGMAWLLKYHQSCGVQRLRLCTEHWNTQARLFYEKFGFIIIERQRRRFLDGSDGICMEVQL